MSLKEFITTSYGVEIYLDTKKLRQAKVWYPRTKNKWYFCLIQVQQYHTKVIATACHYQNHQMRKHNERINKKETTCSCTKGGGNKKSS